MPGHQPERFLATILFTDIVGSTVLAAELGDRGWRDLVEEHNRLVRAAIRRHRGREIDTAGDGFFATFDAPAAAAECAIEVVNSVQALGIQVRAGIHVGEVEQIGAKVAGISVPTTARIMAEAEGGQVLVSGTVRELAAGSGLAFEDRGERTLKGVPGNWRLFAVSHIGKTPGIAAEPGADPQGTAADQAARRAAAVRRSQSRPVWQRHPRLTAGVAVGLVVVIVVASAVAWSPWRPRALAGVTENSVGVIDSRRNEIVAQATVGDQPAGIAVGEGAVWVTNSGSNTVSRIDPVTHAVVDSIDVGRNPAGVAVGGGSVWVACSGDRSVTRINTATGRVVATIPVGNGPTAIAFGAGGVWVANTGDGTLTRIDAATGKAAQPISVGTLPDALAIDESGVWVASQDGATVTHLDAASGTPLGAPIAVGSRPSAIAIGSGSVWVANAGDGSVSRLDPASDRVVGVVDIGGAPSGLALDGPTLWVADATSAVARVAVGDLVAAPVRIGTTSAPKALALVNGEIWFAASASAASHRGGTLRVVSGDPIGLDPNSFANPELHSLIGDGLVGYRHIGGIAGSQLVPDLATAIPRPTDGGLTYTFHVRPGILYSDGTPVRPSDFVFSMERIFQTADPTYGNLGGSFYAKLSGADACAAAPVKRCDLAAGVVADDASATVTFHLSAPDPDFLYKLGLTFAHVVPARSIPGDTLSTGPFPVTGPYQIASVQANSVQLVRNPRFRSWDPQVRPDGYADEIVWTTGIKPADQVAMVQSGSADYMADQIPADAFQHLETQQTQQVHLAAQSTTFVFMNTKLPPFDKLNVRRAVNLAVDRSAVAKLRGGSGVTKVTCQVLPPNFPGYEPYCPHTVDPAPDGRGPWAGPDLAAARRLVAESGAADARIVVGPFVPRLTPLAGYIVTVLRDIGFTNVTEEDATDGSEVFKAVFDEQRVQMGGFEVTQDFPGPDTFLAGFTCDEGDGLSNYCDPALDGLVRDARNLQVNDPPAAARKWAEVDRMVTDLALWCPLVNEGSDFVSARFGNYQYSLSYGVLLDQAWVK